ncbi:MAG: DUF2335 domain-containing protein [Chloroflexi bacterium]|nr:DUF2335 domain-containing protein [Chloroflexota bacterium]
MPEDQDEKHDVILSREVRRYSGPIPPAEEIARYEEVLPGSADRLLSMAEREQRDIVSFRNRVLVATTIITIITILAIVLILTLNADALVVVALALAQALPPVTNFLRGNTDNRLARQEQELDIQIRKDLHEIEMQAARQRLSLPPGSDDDSNSSQQHLASENEQSNDKESGNRD